MTRPRRGSRRRGTLTRCSWTRRAVSACVRRTAPRWDGSRGTGARSRRGRQGGHVASEICIAVRRQAEHPGRAGDAAARTNRGHLADAATRKRWRRPRSGGPMAKGPEPGSSAGPGLLPTAPEPRNRQLKRERPCLCQARMDLARGRRGRTTRRAACRGRARRRRGRRPWIAVGSAGRGGVPLPHAEAAGGASAVHKAWQAAQSLRLGPTTPPTLAVSRGSRPSVVGRSALCGELAGDGSGRDPCVGAAHSAH